MGWKPTLRSHPFDLPVFQFQWGGAAEDGGDDADFALVAEDFVETGKNVNTKYPLSANYKSITTQFKKLI